jgi:hypothetical protein
MANDYCQAVGDLGRATNTRELEVRETSALAVLARTRGNHPDARRLFAAAAEAASKLGIDDVQGLAHQGLMIELAEMGDFDAALQHGWHAFSLARTETARAAESLINLAHLASMAGYPSAALGGLSTALGRTNVPRIRLPALAGTASAAGALRDAGRVAAAARAIAAEASDAFPFETSRAYLALSRAWRAVGNVDAADAAAERAAAIGTAHGFHEVTVRVERESTTPPAPLSDAGLQVIRSLESWIEDPSRELSLSNASMG